MSRLTSPRFWLSGLTAAAVGFVFLYYLRLSPPYLRTSLLFYTIWWLPVLLAMGLFWRQWPHRVRPWRRLRALAPLLVLTLAALLYLFSSMVDFHWFFLNRWVPRSTAVLGYTLPRFILVVAILIPVLAFWTRRVWVLVFVCMVGLQIHLFESFLGYTHGAPLYKDDHPSFLFRLWEFKEAFPRLANYAPYWNGGRVHVEGALSGAHALGYLFWPWWKMFEVHDVYTLVISISQFVLVPLLAAGSIRIMRGSAVAAWCAGILSLGVSQYYFLWLLDFGTVGAMTTTPFLLPVTACVYRVIWLERQEWWVGLTLVASTFFLLLWPPGALMCLPIAVAVLCSGRRWWCRRKLLFLAGCAAVVVLLYSRYLFVVMLKGQAMFEYVAEASDKLEGPMIPLMSRAELLDGWKFLWNTIKEGHPILIFLGLAGCLFAPRRSLRRWAIPMILGFAVMAGWGRHHFPRLELVRMAIPMFVVAILPASFILASLLRTRLTLLAPVRAFLLGLLIIGGHSVGLIYAHKSRHNFTVLKDRTKVMTAWIRDHVPEGGRVAFLGYAMHGYGGGHIAYLPVMTGREMMACDFYHFPPRYVEYQYPPRGFREDAAALTRFAELYNVTHFITFHDLWKFTLHMSPDSFTAHEVPHEGSKHKVTAFEVHRVPSMLIDAEGTVSARFNRIEVALAAPAEEFVVKYNWVDGLEAEPPAEIFPYEAENNVRLIGVRPGGAGSVAIRYPGWL